MLYKICVILHVLSAVTWVGGVLFIGMIAVPAARKLEPDLKRELLTNLGNRFRTVGWSALAILLLTGSYMIWFWGARLHNLLDLSFFQAPHTAVLSKKFLLVATMLVISGIHDWYLGPRAAQPGLDPATTERYRKLASYLGRITGLLVILIVILATFVARPWTL